MYHCVAGYSYQVGDAAMYCMPMPTDRQTLNYVAKGNESMIIMVSMETSVQCTCLLCPSLDFIAKTDVLRFHILIPSYWSPPLGPSPGLQYRTDQHATPDHFIHNSAWISF